MDFSPEERTILSILNDFEHKRLNFSLDAILAHDYWTQQGKDDQVLIKTLDQLIESELVSFNQNTYSLTIQGINQAKKFMGAGFSEMLVAGEQSATSRKFCERVYGLDLCQFNMMGQNQLDKLLAVMKLSNEDQILDLGCGVGLIAEYISDATGSSVMGIDFASGAIERAQERTREKRERLSYQVMDMDELCFPNNSFSGLISIDSLYFVNDLDSTIQSAQRIVKGSGQMGIFYSTTLSEEETTETLEPEHTPIGRVLQKRGLTFQAWEFTQDEIDIYEKMLHAAEELKHEYEAEGNLNLYEASVFEARNMLKALRTGRRSRYLYHIGRIAAT